VLYISAFTAISLGLFTVLMAILQGLSENGLAIKYLILGLILKGILQYPMIFLFKIYGPLVATNLARMRSRSIKLTSFNWKLISKPIPFKFCSKVTPWLGT